jgi:hypothetical protein
MDDKLHASQKSSGIPLFHVPNPLWFSVSAFTTVREDSAQVGAAGAQISLEQKACEGLYVLSRRTLQLLGARQSYWIRVQD